MLMGGHVRVGVEDNLFYEDVNRVPTSNLALTQRVARLAKEFGRPVATAAEMLLLRLGDPENWRETTVTLRKMVADDRPAVLHPPRRWNMAPIAPSAEVPDPERSGINLGEHLRRPFARPDRRGGELPAYRRSDRRDGQPGGRSRLSWVATSAFGCRKPAWRRCDVSASAEDRTEADRPETIHWYVDKFGYHIVGASRKRHPFSRLDRNEWTVLELDLQ